MVRKNMLDLEMKGIFQSAETFGFLQFSREFLTSERNKLKTQALYVKSNYT